MVGGKNSSELPNVLAIARSLLADVTTCEVTLAFRQANIRSILLKGPAIAVWLYEHVSLRPYVDSDILVAAEDIEKAEEVLARLLFMQEPISARTRFDDVAHGLPWHAHSWVRQRDGAGVDLHRTLIGAAADPDEVWRVLSSQTESMPIRDLQVEVLAKAARALHVALHAAQDGGLPKALQDLERAIDHLPIDGWKEASHLAVRLDASPAFAAGLRLLPTGGALASELGLPTEAPLSVALRASGAPRSALSLEWLTRIHGVRSKAVYVWQKLAEGISLQGLHAGLVTGGGARACGRLRPSHRLALGGLGSRAAVVVARASGTAATTLVPRERPSPRCTPEAAVAGSLR